MSAPEQLWDTCLLFTPHQDCLQPMQDGLIMETGYFTGLFAKPQGVQTNHSTENFGSFSRSYWYIHERHQVKFIAKLKLLKPQGILLSTES